VEAEEPEQRALADAAEGKRLPFAAHFERAKKAKFQRPLCQKKRLPRRLRPGGQGVEPILSLLSYARNVGTSRSRDEREEPLMKTTRLWARVALLCVGVALALAAPLAAAASAPEPVRIETHGVFTGPDSTAGTFVISGAVSDSGSYIDSFRLAGETLQVVKTLSGSGGTITLSAQGVVRWTSPTTATFLAGHWQVVSGTGAYAELQGGGYPGASGSANFATGTVDVVHEGQVHVG
jgi:hypothetical protein